MCILRSWQSSGLVYSELTLLDELGCHMLVERDVFLVVLQCVPKPAASAVVKARNGVSYQNIVPKHIYLAYTGKECISPPTVSGGVCRQLDDNDLL